jgi:hypothetical protein
VVRMLFVTGFNRSGTTLVTSAATQAAGAATLTAGDLSRHMPSIADFLASARDQGGTPDRGVDRLPVTESTPEEYGWLLRVTTGELEFGEKAAETGVLEKLAADLTARSGAAAVVLKNPWDTGREQALLGHFPGSQVLLVRRRFGAIADSQERAWARLATSSSYVRALIGDPEAADATIGVITDPVSRQAMVRGARRRLRRSALRLARGAGRLPLERVAFLSYDELRRDPAAGAAWAAHLLDAGAFARAIAALTFPEYNRAGAVNALDLAVDRYWSWMWRRARARQVRAGILAPRSRR